MTAASPPPVAPREGQGPGPPAVPVRTWPFPGRSPHPEGGLSSATPTPGAARVVMRGSSGSGKDEPLLPEQAWEGRERGHRCLRGDGPGLAQEACPEKGVGMPSGRYAVALAVLSRLPPEGHPTRGPWGQAPSLLPSRVHKHFPGTDPLCWVLGQSLIGRHNPAGHAGAAGNSA